MGRGIDVKPAGKPSALWAALAMALVLLVALGAAPAAQAYGANQEGGTLAGATMKAQEDQGYDISWYKGKSSPYTVRSVDQLKGLSALVNGKADIDGDGESDEAVSFEGATVQLSGSLAIIVFEEDEMLEPIGTPEHPFEGTFDGRGGTIVALTLDVGDRLSYVGLFGYAGEHATIRNLRLAGADGYAVKVENDVDGKSISHVGAIAGHVGGDIENCWSSTDVYVRNDGAVPDKKGEKAEELCMVLYVGGLVGSLGGDMVGCTHAKDTSVTIASTSSVDENVPYIGGFIGGIAGFQGDEGNPSHVPSAQDCTNAGPISFNVTGSGGVDRFGVQMYSKSTMVGGIVGYEMGNISDCANTAKLMTGNVVEGVVQSGWGATNVGGIAGSLRGPTIAESASATGIVGSNETDPGYTVWTESNGTAEPPLLSIERCANIGEITGLASVAGICGSTGAFTKVEGCSNTAKIEGTRWNKPCPAGIVGISNGDIAYCYNRGRCFSTTGGGFYASGITSLLTTYNTSNTPDALRTDDPELYGCYVTGNIGGVETGFKTAVLAGENDGFIHDNCFLPNLTIDKAKDKDVFGDEEKHSRLVAESENRGTLANNHELSPEEMKSGLAVVYLNRVKATQGDWSLYYTAVPNAFPVLSWQAEGASAPSDKVALSSVATGIARVENPAYAASYAPIPIVELTCVDGVTLYQDADYRVVVDADAKQIGGTYEATVVGVNGYEGELEQKVTYTIGRADIGTCTVSAAPVVFNWERQVPESITVRDDAGNVVDPSEYEFSVPANEDFSTKAVKGKYYDYVNCHGSDYRYDVTVTAKESSVHFTGSTTQAAFRIKWASMFMSSEEVDDPNKEEDVKLGNVVWDGQEWDIKEALKTKGFVKMKYTGEPIKPTFASVTYLGHEMRDGTGKPYYYAPLDYDYQYIYGNPNPVDENDLNAECINATGSDETRLACVTIRYTPGGNFQNYTNMFYEIEPADIASDVAMTGLKASYPYTGKAVCPVPTLTYNGMTLVKGTDYTLSYKGNTSAGTATMTISGKGNYAGKKVVSFKIASAKISTASATCPARTYNGKLQTPVPTLKWSGKALKKGTDFTVSSYKNNRAAGKATVVVKGKGNFTGTKNVTFTIKKAKQPMIAKAVAVSAKTSALKTKAQVVAPLKVSKAQGKVTYKNASVDKTAKKFKVDAKGKVTVPKGTKKGSYKLKVNVSAAGNANYLSATKTITATVKVV